MSIHELLITGATFPEASVRGIIQTLEPIPESANVVRDINGNAVDIGNPDFRKFASVISCSDQVPPELSALWPGVECTVICVAELSFITIGGAAIRPVYGTPRVDLLHTYYRPILEMIVTGPWQIVNNRWDADVRWQLELQEK